MVQGTGSDVGKSTVVAGLCRAFTKRGLTVRPFKPQNMSNNAAVTPECGEIGRAQALQARACGVPPSTDMNPVLLKPQTDVGSQVVVRGRVWKNVKARDYYDLKPELMPIILESYARLGEDCDLVVIEGAGSPAEVNLRDGDVANMGFALAAGTPVVLIADIDRGGVIANIVGTHALLTEDERQLLLGYIVNKFRGDASLFDAGLEAIGERTGLECFGVLPYLAEIRKLPAEDALGVDAYERRPGAPIRVAVPVISRIANFDDVDPLAAEPDVEVTMIQPGEPLPGDADLVLLPGSKSTVGDLRFLKSQGWDVDIAAHVRRGGAVLGLCGGYQMLGRLVRDPDGVEGSRGEEAGLGLLDVETVISGAKRLERVEGREHHSGLEIDGFEMRMGKTKGPATEQPMLQLGSGPDGAVSADGLVQGCYVHGLFAADAFRHAFLARLKSRSDSGLRYEAEIERALDALATHCERHLHLDRLLEAANGS
ncbi:MAG: cobyric acid synthase [Alphaproteobacteria bacterium]|nr:cobyric acid synthase [Alphaproteobacteria bacterium]